MEPTSRIGSYLIEEQLAATDLSEVFAARDAEGRRVCIKRLRPNLVQHNSAVVLSFRREAALLAEVRHPNVVRVLEVGEDEGGVPFTCLELVEGDPLSERLSKGEPVPIAEALEMLRQIALGLSRVHDRGVIHADLKPSNILLQRGAGEAELKIADFGLAAEAAGQAAEISGTPHYMSPEQTRLVDWPVDFRSDLYSLGVLAFELFTGKLPFDEADPARLMLAQVSQKPPRPTDLRPDIPAIVEQLLLKLLEKNPADRYRSAQGLVQDLEQIAQRLRAGDRNPEFTLDAAADPSAWIGQVFVGRSRELQELEGALERARMGRRGAVFVGGVAGVGKSALLKEFQNRAITRGARFAVGKCYEFSRALPYYALAEALTDHFRRLKQLPEAERSALIERVRASAGPLAADLVKVAPALAPMFPDVKPTVYLGEGKDRVRFLEMLERVLEAIAPPGNPLLLLLDDLQWADSATLQALEALVESVRESSLVLLATFRSDEVGPEHRLQRLLPKDRARAGQLLVDLRPFDLPQTKVMIAESLRQPVSAFPESFFADVHSRTGGNPLFVSEVLKALSAAGAVKVQNGALTVLADKVESASLPTSVVDIVLRRVEALAPQTRTVLGAAALTGKGFTLPLVSRAAEVSEPAAFGAIQEALTHRVLQPPRAGVFRFHHDRVQEACRRLIPKEEQPALHRRLIDFLEEGGAAGEDSGDAVFELAEHASLANDAARGFKYCGKAAELARSRYANEQALGYFRRALEQLERSGVQEPRAEQQLRAAMCEVLDLLGRYSESIPEYGRILQGELSSEDRARFLSKLGMAHRGAGDYKHAIENLTQALDALGVKVGSGALGFRLLRERFRYFLARVRTRLFGPKPDGRRLLVVDILTRLWIVIAVGDAKRSPHIAYRTIAEAHPLGPSRELSVAHRNLVLTLAQLRRPRWEEAIRHGMRAVEVGRAVGAQLETATAMLYTSDIFCWSARYREAFPWLQNAREALSALGNMWELANTHIFSYLAYRCSGRLDEALQHAQALVELGERIGAFGTISNGNQKVADILLLRGDSGRGEAHLSKSLGIAEERKLNFERFSGLKIQGAARLREGRFDEARRAFQAAITLVETPGISFFQAYVSDAYFGFAEACLRDLDYLASVGGTRGEEGRRLRRYLDEKIARERLLRGHLGHGLRVRGIFLARDGRTAAARRSFEQSLSVLQQQDRPLEAAITQLEAARALAEVFPADAVAWLQRAAPAFEEQRVRPLLADCERLLKRLGHAPSAAAAPADERSTRALKELVTVSRMLMQSRDPDILLERIVDSSVSLLGAERGFVFVRQPDGSLQFRVGKTADGSPLSAEEAGRISRTVLERVDSSGKGVAVSDTDQDETLRERRSVMAYQLRSVLCAPLAHAEDKLGVIYLDSQISQALFAERELELLQSFAAQAAVALANATQFATIHEMNRDLDAKVLERTRQLASAKVQVEASLHELKTTTLRLAEARREALEKELTIARTIQLAMVPKRELIKLPGASVAGLLQPASFCGGDFWTFVRKDDRSILLIGDVTGHGVGSAMVTTVAKSCLDTIWLELSGQVSLNRIFQTMNDIVCGSTQGGMALTAFGVEVDPVARKLRFCVAGHGPQFLLRPKEGGRAEVIGLFARENRMGDGFGNTFELVERDYFPGDRLVLFTDGLTECTDPSGAQYGERRLRRLLQAKGALGPAELLAEIETDSKQHYGTAEQEDDITLVVASLG